MSNKLFIKKDHSFFYGYGDNKIDFRISNPDARRDLLEQLALSSYGLKFKIAELKQVHGNKIISIEDTGGECCQILPEADGVFTANKGIILCIKTADCVPVLFYDKCNNVIGAIHCGWRGIFNDIIINVKNILLDFYLSDIENVKAFIGPSICKNCYEIKDDLYNEFINKNLDYKNFFTEISSKNSSFLFDIKGLIKNELSISGFKKNNIYDINICNYENNKFFSFRRNTTDSRFVSFIGAV